MLRDEMVLAVSSTSGSKKGAGTTVSKPSLILMNDPGGATKSKDALLSLKRTTQDIQHLGELGALQILVGESTSYQRR